MDRYVAIVGLVSVLVASPQILNAGPAHVRLLGEFGMILGEGQWTSTLQRGCVVYRATQAGATAQLSSFGVWVGAQDARLIVCGTVVHLDERFEFHELIPPPRSDAQGAHPMHQRESLRRSAAARAALNNRVVE